MSVETSKQILEIEKSVELNLQYPSVSERYFSHYFFIPINPFRKTMIKPKSVSAKVAESPSNEPCVDVNGDLCNSACTNNVNGSAGTAACRSADDSPRSPPSAATKEKKASRDADFLPKGEDTCVMVHSNRICVVALSPRHPVVALKKTITKIDFNVSGVDRLSNKVSGKGKRGAQIVGLFSPLCSLECDDQSSYVVYAGVRGKLVEINERLIQSPHLIVESPTSDGYLAVVLPKLNKVCDSVQELLLSKQEYENVYAELLLQPAGLLAR